jgi:hypothetical protein
MKIMHIIFMIFYELERIDVISRKTYWKIMDLEHNGFRRIT